MKLLVIATALILPASAPVEPAQPALPARTLPPPPMSGDREMPNAFSAGGPECMPIARQVDAEKRRLRRDDARTLDREPMAFGFLAVDRQVGGCREVTFLDGRPRTDQAGR
jgi:hypothetical protein